MCPIDPAGSEAGWRPCGQSGILRLRRRPSRGGGAPGGGYDPPRGEYDPPGENFGGSKLGSLGFVKAWDLQKKIPVKNDVEWHHQK